MIAAVFPGQGSQKPGMGQSLCESFLEAKSAFELISDATSVDVAKLCFESDEETLRLTQNAQLALYTCGIAAWSVLRAHYGGEDLIAAAGHSVGEYAALAASGVVSIEDGARLVQFRGKLMSASGEKVAGTMAAVLGLTREELEVACGEAEGIVVVANDNCPGQLVISGEVGAVKKAGEIAAEKGAKRVLPLNVSGAFHSPLMQTSSVEMGKALAQVPFKHANLHVYSNVTSEPVDDPTILHHLLEEQLRSPVRWTESIKNMLRDGIRTFVECGVGEVLSGLVRRIDRDVTTLKIYDQASYQATMDALTGKTGA